MMFAVLFYFERSIEGGNMTEILKGKQEEHKDEIKYVEGLCGICPGSCAVEIELVEGKINKIKASEKHSPSAICLRGSKSKGIVYAKDRLTKPLIRTGPKGTNEFREATWDEALQYAADGFNKIINKYGPQALVSHSGRGAFDQTFDNFMRVTMPDGNFNGFFAPIGSPNGGSVGSLCYVSFGIFAPMTTMGLQGPEITPDNDNADTIVIWGSNPPTASPPLLFNKLKKLRKEGTRIVTVDHYDSIMAKNSDEKFIARTGSDIVLILGLISYLVEEGKYDKKFVENYTFGFEELYEYAKEFTLEKVISSTGLSEKEFYELADIVSSERVSLHTYTGLEYTNSGVQSIRALYSLWAICGHLDRKGGLLLSKPRSHSPFPREKENYDYKLRPIGAEEFPLFEKYIRQPQMTRFPEAVLESKPYKAAGLFNVGSTISINYPNSKIYEEALMALDMFVTVDRFMTKDALYADVILPSTTHYEDETYAVVGGKVRRRKRIIEPIGEARTDIFIAQQLAEKMGFGEYYPKDEEELLERRFKHLPKVLEDLKAGEEEVELPKPEFKGYEKYKTGGLRADDDRPGFNTPTGKFEFKSTILESYGYDGLPIYTPAKEGEINTPELYEKYPLILNTGARIQTTFRTQHLNIPELVKIQPHPLIHLNTDDAKERGIEEGDEVVVTTPRGEIKVVATLSDNINSGDTELNIGGGQDMQIGLWAQANVNYMTEKDNQDPISGFPVFKDLLCEVAKA